MTVAEAIMSPKQARAKRSRRTQEERSQETRTKLLNATGELLIERGYGKITVDDISSRAGVTNGARAHHYGTKLDLMVETFKHIQAPVFIAARDAARDAEGSPDPLGAFFEHSVSIFLAPSAVAFTELLMGARTDAALRERLQPEMNAQHERVQQPWIELLIKSGYPANEVKPMVLATVSFMRGISTDPLVDLHDPSIEALVEFWRAKISADSTRRGPAAIKAKQPLSRGAKPKLSIKAKTATSGR